MRGKGDVTLTDQHFKAQGGEGKIYVLGGQAYKIYLDPTKMIPEAKIRELSVLSAPNIIKPELVLMDSKNKPVGYSMRTVPGQTYPLIQTFPKAFRDRNKLDPQKMLALVRKLQEGVGHCHSHKILVVDLNEMNFLVDHHFKDIFFLDVDSYQTPSFPATALMESVRDRHMQGYQFNTGTDWFSFGVVSFQMMVGIHPYKGKHSSIKDLDSRMKKNVSVLNPDVSVPATVLPFSLIPRIYLDWYEAIFEKGQRVPPPADLTAVIIVQTPQVTAQMGSNQFDIEEIFDLSAPISYYLATSDLMVTGDGVFAGKRFYPNTPADAKIAITPKFNHPVVGYIDGFRMAKFYDLINQKDIAGSFAAEEMMHYDGRIYIRRGLQLLELEFVEFSNQIIVNMKHIGNVTENSSRMYDGVLIQNMLGACYASIMPSAGLHYQPRLKELDGYQIVDAKYENKVLMVVGSKAGKYDRFVLRFDDTYLAYDVSVVTDISYTGLNFTVLDQGVVIHINEDEEVEVFTNRKGSSNSNMQKRKDPAIGGDCKLFHRGTQALFARGNKLYKFKMI